MITRHKNYLTNWCKPLFQQYSYRTYIISLNNSVNVIFSSTFKWCWKNWTNVHQIIYINIHIFFFVILSRSCSIKNQGYLLWLFIDVYKMNNIKITKYSQIILLSLEKTKCHVIISILNNKNSKRRYSKRSLGWCFWECNVFFKITYKLLFLKNKMEKISKV